MLNKINLLYYAITIIFPKVLTMCMSDKCLVTLQYEINRKFNFEIQIK